MSDAVITRVKPNSLEAEQGVIGSMIMDNRVIDEALEILTKEDFYYQQYGMVFEAIAELKAESNPVDLITVTEQLRKNGAPPEISDGKHLGELAESMLITRNIRSYAEIVKNKSLLRQIIEKNREVEDLCFDGSMDVDEILDATEQNFLSLLQKRGVSDARPIEDIAEDAIEMIRRAYSNKGMLTGIPTGFTDLDEMTAGLQNADMILVAARPSMGKTAFALNIAAHVAFREQLSVAIFSLEMPDTNLVQRLYSLESGIDAQKLRKGELEEYDWPRLIEARDEVANSKLIIDQTPAISISELRSKCRKYKQQNDLRLVVIDYLQLITTGGKTESRQQEISNISRSLKSLARELNVPVIALSQLNRSVEARDDKRPMLSDLRDSGAIEQDADVVLMLYRDEYYNKDTKDKGISEVIIAKQRNGPTGMVQLAWLASYTKFANRSNPRNQVGSADY